MKHHDECVRICNLNCLTAEKFTFNSNLKNIPLIRIIRCIIGSYCMHRNYDLSINSFAMENFFTSLFSELILEDHLQARFIFKGIRPRLNKVVSRKTLALKFAFLLHHRPVHLFNQSIEPVNLQK